MRSRANPEVQLPGKHSGLYVLCGDDARFLNHSENPNCFDFYSGEEQDITVAERDIYLGEELTCNYALFDLDWTLGKYRISVSNAVQSQTTHSV
jgi:hypothetical protein